MSDNRVSYRQAYMLKKAGYPQDVARHRVTTVLGMCVYLTPDEEDSVRSVTYAAPDAIELARWLNVEPAPIDELVRLALERAAGVNTEIVDKKRVMIKKKKRSKNEKRKQCRGATSGRYG